MYKASDYNYFVCIVAGDNPKDIMAEYDKNKQVAPYVVYRFADAAKLHKMYIESYEAERAKMNAETSEFEIQSIENYIEYLKDLDDTEFFVELAEKYEYVLDEETYDATSTKNRDGKWSFANIGNLHSIPFMTTDGREVYQAKKSDIAWDKIHLSGAKIYERAWEMVMDGSKPENEYEQQIYDNMKDKQDYFAKFDTKEIYVTSNTAFWGYAFVSDKTGWREYTDDDDQFVWMSNFYDIFIKNLPDDTLLTIYECRK